MIRSPSTKKAPMAQGKSMVSNRYNTTADKALASGRSRRNNRTKTASTEPMPAGVGMTPARDWLKAVSEKHCKAVKGRDSAVELRKTIQGMRYQVVNFNRLHRNRRRSSRGSFNRDRLSACSRASLCPAPVAFPPRRDALLESDWPADYRQSASRER